VGSHKTREKVNEFGFSHRSLVLPIMVWWWVQADEIAVGEEREYISTLWVFRSLVKL